MRPDSPPRKQLRPLVLAFFSVAMLACAAASNAVMDTLSFRYEKSVFAAVGMDQVWFNPKLSWRNKWKGGDPASGEAYPGSSTVFVAFTDAWHTFKSLTIFFVIAAVIAPFTAVFSMKWPLGIAVLIGLKILYGVIFESLFSWGLISR